MVMVMVVLTVMVEVIVMVVVMVAVLVLVLVLVSVTVTAIVILTGQVCGRMFGLLASWQRPDLASSGLQGSSDGSQGKKKLSRCKNSQDCQKQYAHKNDC